jgi:hypothetical protein
MASPIEMLDAHLKKARECEEILVKIAALSDVLLAVNLDRLREKYKDFDDGSHCFRALGATFESLSFDAIDRLKINELSLYLTCQRGQHESGI